MARQDADQTGEHPAGTLSSRKRDPSSTLNLREIVQSVHELDVASARTTILEEICASTLAALEKCVGVRRSSILIADSQGVMRLKAWRGISEECRAAVEGHPPWSPETADPQPILIPEAEREISPEGLKNIFLKEGIRAVAFIPLATEGRLLGQFTLCYDSPHRFTSEEVQVATMIAAQVAFAIDRKRLADEREQLLVREKAARKESEELNRVKNDFLAMLSRELRDPLAAILNGIDVLDKISLQKREAIRIRGLIRRQARHLGRLVDDLLDLTRIEQGKVVLKREQIDMRAVVARSLDAARHALEARSQQPNLSLPPTPVVVDGDRDRLHQIVGNIVNNACQYTPTGGKISVTLTAIGGEALLQVGDTDPTLARTDVGPGIGLSLVRHLVELHGGGVVAHSEGEGRGSEFVVRIPLVDQAEWREPAPGASLPASRHRVLVIEDNEVEDRALRTPRGRLGRHRPARR